MGEKFWKKICDENFDFRSIGSGEGETNSFRRYAEYACDVGETHLTAYAGGNILRGIQIKGKYNLRATFLPDSDMVVVRPTNLTEKLTEYFPQIGILEKEYEIKTSHFLELLSPEKYTQLAR